ncbi:hypothetical protein AB0D33_17990 [Streptomyces sp. NPDC048404]|uniref:hypothetical protein n=1 Tax=unclassified Streptomyces TaxID=2593676 RepID=UPI003428D5D6
MASADGEDREDPSATLATVLRAVRDSGAEKLREGDRPYAAVLALADRPDLETEGVRSLGTLRPAAS